MPVAVISSRTRDRYNLPPQGPFVCNAASEFAQGLIHWFPLGFDGGTVLVKDYNPLTAKYHLTLNGTTGYGGNVFGGSGWANTGSTSNYLINNGTPPSVAPPHAIACWFNAADATTRFDLAYWARNTGSTVNHEGLSLNVTAGKVSAISGSGTEANGASSNSFTALTPNLGIALFTADNNRQGGLNGLLGTSQTTQRGPVVQQLSVGALKDGANAVVNAINGTMWNLCFWNYAITPAMCMRLYSPEWRWDLYYTLGRTTYSFPAPAAPATSGLLLRRRRMVTA